MHISTLSYGNLLIGVLALSELSCARFLGHGDGHHRRHLESVPTTVGGVPANVSAVVEGPPNNAVVSVAPPPNNAVVTSVTGTGTISTSVQVPVSTSDVGMDTTCTESTLIPTSIPVSTVNSTSTSVVSAVASISSTSVISAPPVTPTTSVTNSTIISNTTSPGYAPITTSITLNTTSPTSTLRSFIRVSSLTTTSQTSSTSFPISSIPSIPSTFYRNHTVPTSTSSRTFVSLPTPTPITVGSSSTSTVAALPSGLDKPCYNSSCSNPDSGMNYRTTIKVDTGSGLYTGGAARRDIEIVTVAAGLVAVLGVMIVL